MSSLTGKPKNAAIIETEALSSVSMKSKPASPAVQKAFSKTYNLYGIEKRRDAIIALIQQQHRGEPFVAPFVAHLQKIGAEKLDPYSKMEFHLQQFGIQLTFLTSSRDEGEMNYPIADLIDEPDFRLKREKTFFEWLTGRT